MTGQDRRVNEPRFFTYGLQLFVQFLSSCEIIHCDFAKANQSSLDMAKSKFSARIL